MNIFYFKKFWITYFSVFHSFVSNLSNIYLCIGFYMKLMIFGDEPLFKNYKLQNKR